MRDLIDHRKAYDFLHDGGEMGALTRAYDWSATSIGSPAQWPQSLKTIVSVILLSDFPMFLWWGDEMIQFYNDAYRPSLGDNGKHPKALGQDAVTCWPEIWSVIYPLIKQVRETGKSFFAEDQLIPIFRNGRMEDVYWTFSYSAVKGDTGDIEGVLVVCNETTEKVNAVNKLSKTTRLFKESENNLRKIIRKAPSAMCILKGRNHIVEIANERMFELWGRPGLEITGKPLFEVLPEASGQGFEQLLDKVLTTGESVSDTEVPVVLPRNGTTQTIYVNFTYEAFHEDDGRISGVMAVAYEVTESVLQKKQLVESEEKYKTLIQGSTVAMALYSGRDLRIRYVNKIMTDYWGKDLSVAGKKLSEAVPELAGQPFLDLLDRVYVTGQDYFGKEERATLLVGGRLQDFYFNYSFKALRDSSNVIYGIHHMAADVTETVLARKKVVDSEANLRNIITQAPVAMCILKGKSQVVDVANDKILEIWGKRYEEVLNKPIFDALPEARSQGLEKILDDVFVTGQRFSATERPVNLLKNGRVETKYIDFVYEAFYQEGVIAGVMAVAIEVTDQVLARHKIEDIVSERTVQLAESNRDLLRSNDELAQFAYIASHDLQEPARKINTFSEMLRKNLGRIDDRSEAYLRKIEQSSSRMLTLIRDVLTFSQLAKTKNSFVQIDLNDIMISVISDFELYIEQKQAIIQYDKLPVIEGIHVQISQLFNNLISNALKFVSENNPEIKVKVSTLSKHESLQQKLDPDRIYHHFQFIDNGIGFSQSNAEQIFDIFQRLHAKSEYQGTGIGLAMCRKICINHGGSIYAESKLGSGATFHVILPQSQD